ncbi:MAG: DUF3124 domain-containing protein [Alphaproteobacteria bacterium]
MKPASSVVLSALAAILCACEPGESAWETKVDFTEQFFQPENDVRLGRSEALYVPVYSSVLTGEGARPTELAATLSIRNTDLASPIFVTSVTYYDTAGQLIETFLEGAHGLGPMASASIIINVSDTRGGLGANFIVEWGAEKAVSDPIVEAVMIGSSGTHGFSFTSQARGLNSGGQ